MTRNSSDAEDGPPGAAAARLGDRVLAYVIDVVAVALVAWGLYSVAGDPALDGVRLLVTVAMFVYLAILHGWWGASLGKWLMNLKVVGSDFDPPGLLAGAVRNAWVLFGVIPRPLEDVVGLVVVLSIALSVRRDAEGRGWHDRLAGTRVVDLGAAHRVTW